MLKFSTLYQKMGELCLFDLRDELWEWKNRHNYKYRDYVPSCLPNRFIKPVLQKMQERNSKIMKILRGT